MEQDKSAKTERLIQTISEIDDKISKLTAKRDAANEELINTHNAKIVSVIRNVCKTPEEIAAFIRLSEKPDFIVGLIKQIDSFENKNGERMEGTANETLGNSVGKAAAL